MNNEIINKIITGRVEPHIYAFETCSVPNYLKIGDTYRPVYQRLEEWRRHYKNLQKLYEHPAVIENKYFRDYAVHAFVEDVKGRRRIKDEDFQEGLYHSKEFFKDATPADIKEAINDIRRSYQDQTGEYNFYSMLNVPEQKNDNYQQNNFYTELRDNQKEVVKNFGAALDKGRTKLLMYAIMRFGKSVTAMSCAEAMPNCNLVVIVSAKADVKDSWESTIKVIKNFEDFIYADGESLKENPQIISETISEGKKLAICLTLQDISSQKIKDRYDELFNKCEIDLLIVDETHFGARAEHLGKVLQSDPSVKTESDSDEKEESFEELEKTVHALKCRVQLHLSGTPYRILLGNEFSEEDIICQCTYPDIIKASEDWDAKNLDNKEEWENPYYGFPQMVRFAFNFNASSLKKIEQLRKQGKDYFFDALFVAKKNNDGEYVFVNETEVLDFLKAINSGDEDSNILSFLSNDRIKEGKLCHHVVMVLPRRASCDAMESLLKSHSELMPLSEYTIVNAAGITNRVKKLSSIKSIIRTCESEGKRTLTLTVNRLLTGTTVPEWDTMIFLKGTSSPQEYDQAIYRLQNPFVKTYKDEEGKEIKYNMKPQTLLVDFSPERMFVLQEKRAFYSSVNSQEYGNDKIEKEIQRELDISPILYVNHDKLQEVSAVDILDKIRMYSSNRSIMDEAMEVGTDYTLKDNEDLYAEIMRYAPIGSANIMTTKAHEADKESDADIPDENNGSDSSSKEHKDDEERKEKETDSYEKRLATYFSHILFFAYLTKDTVKNISDICSVSGSEDNQRIASHLGLKLDKLEKLAVSMHPTRREILEFKIANINDLSHDTSILPTQKVENAMKQFGRWSESEVITPNNIASDMIALIPEESVGNNFCFLDIASKEGEFANAIFKRFGDRVKNNIFSLPTSGVAYEFTRKVYEELGLPVENIISEFNTYDLLGKNKEKYLDIIKTMKINAIVGNPPYQINNGSGGTNDAPVYQDFALIGLDYSSDYSCMIMKAIWYAGGRKNRIDDFRKRMLNSGQIRKLITFNDSHQIFPGTQIKGGVCYYLADKNDAGLCDYTYNRPGCSYSCQRNLSDFDILIRDPQLAAIVKKVVRKETENPMVSSIVSSDTPFGIPSNPQKNKKTTYDIVKEKDSVHNVKCYYMDEHNKRTVGYMSKSVISKNSLDIKYPKVLIPEAYGAGEDFPHQILGEPIVAGAMSVCSQSYLYARFDTQKEAKNFEIYLKTRFFRALTAAAKMTQHAMSKVYRFVPIQDFSITWTDEMLYAKYEITPDEQQYIKSIIKQM